jgi:hypothetical protein
MAKIAVIVLTLVLLGVWSVFANRAMTDWSGVHSAAIGEAEAAQLTYADLPIYVLGLHTSQSDRVIVSEPPEGAEVVTMPYSVLHDSALPDVRALLGAILVLAITMLYMTRRDAGGPLSVNLAVLLAFFTAMAHVAFVCTVLGWMAWQMFVFEDRRAHLLDQYTVSLYAMLLYLAVTLVSSVVLLRWIGDLAKGSATAMKRVATCLAVLVAVGLPLYWQWVLPEFRLLTYHGVLWLAALSVASLALIGLTYSNYRYD